MDRSLKNSLINTGLGLGGVALGGLVARAVVRHSRYMDPTGKTVLITGGSRGLGLDLAREAMSRGARVAICARIERELDVARTELFERGGNVMAIQCDVTYPSQVNEMVQAILGRFGSIDVVINNAGTMTISPMEYLNVDDYQKSLRTHFGAALYTTLAVLPWMQRHGGGRIVNIASIGGKVPLPHMIPYCASKFALVGFSEACRAELARKKIYVTTVSPGLMRTGSPRNVDVRGQVQKEYAWFATSDVLPVVSMDPRRVARRVLDAASYGQAELILPVTARFAAMFHGLFPGLCCELTALANRFLPAAQRQHARRAKGFQSESDLVPEFARIRNERAAEEHNEFIASDTFF